MWFNRCRVVKAAEPVRMPDPEPEPEPEPEPVCCLLRVIALHSIVPALLRTLRSFLRWLGFAFTSGRFCLYVYSIDLLGTRARRAYA